MHRIRVWAELSDEKYHDLEGEAGRQGVRIEELLERTVNCLLRELERDEREDTSFIVPS
jgi:hypothetical protein